MKHRSILLVFLVKLCADLEVNWKTNEYKKNNFGKFSRLLASVETNTIKSERTAYLQITLRTCFKYLWHILTLASFGKLLLSLLKNLSFFLCRELISVSSTGRIRYLLYLRLFNWVNFWIKLIMPMASSQILHRKEGDFV